MPHVISSLKSHEIYWINFSFTGIIKWHDCKNHKSGSLEPLFSSVQLPSHVWLFATPWTSARQASLSTVNSWSLFKLISIVLVMPSNHLILCWSPSPAFSLSQHQGLFQWLSSSHQVAKVLELVTPVNNHVAHRESMEGLLHLLWWWKSRPHWDVVMPSEK